MAFRSEMQRSYWGHVAKVSTLDVVIALAIAWLISDDQGLWIVFFVILAILWIAPIGFALKGAVYKYLFYRLEKRKRVSALKREFRKAELPRSDEFFDDAEQYFRDVAESDSAPKTARIFAAATLGQMALLPSYSPIDTLISNVTAETALSEYFDEIRRDDGRQF